MRRQLFLGLSLLAIAGMWTGCSNDEVVKTAGEKRAISFRVQGGVPTISRTTATTKDKVDAFVVYGTDDKASENIFKGVTVARVAGTTTNAFDYNPKRYYSEDATETNFVAYSPVSSSLTATATSFATPEVTFTYEVTPPDASGLTAQEDLLIAGVNDNDLSTSKGAVSFNFTHALSRIFVKATNSMSETVVINSLTLKNLKTKGTLEGTPVAGNDWTWEWTPKNDIEDVSFVLATTGVAVPGETIVPTLVTSMEQGMMVLPQKTANTDDDVATDFALEVGYDTFYGAKTAYVFLADAGSAPDGIYEFKMNNQYAITIAFTGVKISFDIEVTPFSDITDI